MTGPKVLILEADKSFAVQLAAAFRRAGCLPMLADDAQALINTAMSDLPAAIIVAVEVGPLNGFAVCNRIRKNADTKDTPLFLTSDRVPQETFDQHAKLRIRADEYVRKPTNAEDVVRRAARWIKLPVPPEGAAEFGSHPDRSSPRILPPTNDAAGNDGESDLELSYDGVVLQDENKPHADVSGRPAGPLSEPARELLQLDEPAASGVSSRPGAPTHSPSHSPSPSSVRPGMPSSVPTAVTPRSGYGTTSNSTVGPRPMPPGSVTSNSTIGRPGAPLNVPAGVNPAGGNTARSFFVPSVPTPAGGGSSPPPRTDGSVVRRFAELEANLAKAHAAAREREMLAAEVARLGRELEDARAGTSRTATAVPSGPSREFLELRESIIRKDREITRLTTELNARTRVVPDTDAGRRIADLTARLRDVEAARESDRAAHKEAVSVLDRRVAELEAQVLQQTEKATEEAARSLVQKEQTAQYVLQLEKTRKALDAAREIVEATLASITSNHANG